MMKKPVIIMMIFFVVTFFFAFFSVTAIAEDEDHGGDIIYTKPVKAVLFSHEVHVEKLELDCDDCHEEVFEMEALLAQEDRDFTMEGLSEGKYCGACHEGSIAFSSDTQCARCHIGVKGYNAMQDQQDKMDQ